MSTILTPDICVIGGGSGGLTVAAAAAAFGVNVVLIEKWLMGGDCLNYGCVPSKALIAAAKRAHVFRTSSRFGIATQEPVIDFAGVRAYVRSVIDSIASHDSVERFTGLGVKVVQGAGRFVSPDEVAVNDMRIRARRFVIATGSSAFVPPVPGLADVPYLTNESIFDLETLPAHLLILGGGPIGIELGQAFARLGSRVTIVEAAKALGKDDPELSAIVLDALRREGVEIREQTKATAVQQNGEQIALTVETAQGPETLTGTHLLVAAGRTPNIGSLDLPAARVDHDRRGIKTGPGLRTSNRRIYAIGDVTGGLQLTHVAGYHAGLVVQEILFRLPGRENRLVIPWATYSEPELAHVGLSEADALSAGKDIRVLRFPYSGNDRAQAEGETEGLIKIVVDKRSRLLGVTIAGAGAGEMINLWALSLSNKFTLKNIRSYIPPYPTMTEIGKRAAMSYYAPLAQAFLIRSVIRFLRWFG